MDFYKCVLGNIHSIFLILRHADAGYEIAIATAKQYGIKMPMLK